MKITQDDGTEIEVYTAEDVAARVKEKEDAFGKTKSELEAERDEARNALGERSGEFRQFRKLNDEMVKKLSVADRTIYENGLALNEAREKAEAREKSQRDADVARVISEKAKGDAKLIEKMTEMWPLMGLASDTPEQMAQKAQAVLGAIGATQPDLVASVAGFSGGSYMPPNATEDGEKGFGETDRGKAAAAELSLMTEPPKKA